MRRPVLATLAVVVLAQGCGLDRNERRVVRSWLSCDDCRSERAQVAGLGNRAVRSLRRALRRGPTQGQQDNVVQQLRDEWQAAGPGPLAVDAYVNRYLGAYLTTFRSRAATSLGDIGTPDAIAVLEDALADDAAGIDTLPTAVEQAVNAALGRTRPRYDGFLSDSVVDFLDTVLVREGQLTWDGNESLTVAGAPFPADLVVSAGADSFMFVAAAPPGSYALTLSGLGLSGTGIEETHARNLRVAAMRYTAHGPATALDIGAGPFPRRFLFALGMAVARDSIENIRFTVPVGTDVTATARWSGGANIDLRWRSCLAPAVQVGNTAGVTNGHPEQTSVSIPVGCWLLQAVMRPPYTSNPIVRVDVTSP